MNKGRLGFTGETLPHNFSGVDSQGQRAMRKCCYIPIDSGRRHAFGAGLRAATATLNEQRRSGAQASAV